MRPLNIEELKEHKNKTWHSLPKQKPTTDRGRESYVKTVMRWHALDLAIENYPNIIMTDTGLSMTRREWDKLNEKKQ